MPEWYYTKPVPCSKGPMVPFAVMSHIYSLMIQMILDHCWSSFRCRRKQECLEKTAKSKFELEINVHKYRDGNRTRKSVV